MNLPAAAFLPLLFLPGVVSADTPTVTLSWNAVTTMDDGTPLPTSVSVSYNIYGSHAAAGPFTLAANVLSTSSVRSSVALGLDCYRVTAVVSGKESQPSAVACITVTASTIPSAPTGVTATQ